ncbi:MAG: phosphatidylserine decarboxylase family protein [Phycisphaerales bacterium]|nr:phosphatidylserine decarboxylase family protein [Phycisphaerales bacterium]
MTLSPYGIREWGMATAAAIAALILVWPSQWMVFLVVILWMLIVAFFRDPLWRRPATVNPDDLVSPADGVVSAVLELPFHEAVGGPATIVRVFLSVLDVHINRMPCEARVVSVQHSPGRYLDARTPESAQVNESNLIIIEGVTGVRLGVRQVSGAIARRIVCAVGVGSRVTRGERFGMIKFGSTTELIIPTRATNTIRVAKGARVTGGVTVLASMPSV